MAHHIESNASSTHPSLPNKEITRGLVLSGGGARGAYEVGVLSYIVDELPGHLLKPGCLPVLSGTSVGAIHACYVAGTANALAHHMDGLIKIWEDFPLEEILRLHLKDIMSIPFELSSIFLRN